jgi:hypothetical protein
MDRRTGWIGGVVAALIFAVAASAAPGAATPAKEPAAPAPLRFLPKSRLMSTYDLGARFEISTLDITFDAPEAYQAGFNFWASRMKGQKRSEVCQMMTVTQGAGETGAVSFRRTIPKFDIELIKNGEVFAPGVGVGKNVATLVWEGSLDPFGNVKEMRKTAGEENAEVAELAIPEMSRVFPETSGPRELKVGEGFKDERVVRLPTKLNIAGLEKVTIKWTREYTLKSLADGIATFDVKTTYANDPAFKPEMERTTCQVSGGGSGEAVFEIKRGVFVSSRRASRRSRESGATTRTEEGLDRAGEERARGRRQQRGSVREAHDPPDGLRLGPG